MKGSEFEELLLAARELLRVMEETIICAGGDPAKSAPCVRMHKALGAATRAGIKPVKEDR